MIHFQSLTQPELAALLTPHSRDEKQGRYRAKQIFHWVYQRYVTDWDQMTDVSKPLREWLKANVEIFALTERLSQGALDGTHKFLWTLPDERTIESVIIPAALQEKKNVEGEAASEEDDETPAEREARLMRAGKRYSGRETHASPIRKGAPPRKGEESAASQGWSRLTACISSQVGCAMACKFCLTGIQGLDRSLQTHEIVTQVYELRKRAPITNIVFMGMGEPLHNLENVIKACQILIDDDGMGFSKRKVTVSTSGLVSGIEELGRRVDVSLAISLNASTDEQRSEIMPVNKKWNIDALMEACRNFPLGPHRRITFEYVMLRDFNDSLEDAARVIRHIRGIPSKVNLIPFNEHPGSPHRRPDDERVRAFQRYLLDRGVTTTVRISRGRDILAACGQLRSIFGTARGTDRHKDWAGQAQAQPAAPGA